MNETLREILHDFDATAGRKAAKEQQLCKSFGNLYVAYFVCFFGAISHFAQNLKHTLKKLILIIRRFQ